MIAGMEHFQVLGKFGGNSLRENGVVLMREGPA